MEKTGKEADGRSPDYVLHLYVSGSTPRSLLALVNLKALCDRYLKDRYELDVIDIYQQPKLALEAQIIATPTLIKEAPEPVRIFIGTLSNVPMVLQRLGVPGGV